MEKQHGAGEGHVLCRWSEQWRERIKVFREKLWDVMFEGRIAWAVQRPRQGDVFVRAETPQDCHCDWDRVRMCAFWGSDFGVYSKHDESHEWFGAGGSSLI